MAPTIPPSKLTWFTLQETTRHTDPLDPHYRYNVPDENWINNRLSGEAPRPVTQKVKDDWYIGPVDRKHCVRFSTGAPLKSTPGLNGDTTYREYMLKTEGAHAQGPWGASGAALTGMGGQTSWARRSAPSATLAARSALPPVLPHPSPPQLCLSSILTRTHVCEASVTRGCGERGLRRGGVGQRTTPFYRREQGRANYCGD
eukprot:2281945-Rhodomonas_salina.1